MAQPLPSAHHERYHLHRASPLCGNREDRVDMHYPTSSLKNYHLAASDGVIGQVKDVYFDSHTWTVRYLVVNTGAWLFGREVLIPAQALGRVEGVEKSIRVNLTLPKIKGAPESDSALPVSRQDDYARHEYYGFAPGIGPWVALHAAASPTLEEGSSMHAERAGRGDFYLRSAHDAIGHTVRGSDDEIGGVADFLIDDADWSIRYFIVTTAIWFGHKVVLPTAAVREVSWDDRTVYLTLPRERVRHAPKYDASQSPADLEPRLAGWLPSDKSAK